MNVTDEAVMLAVREDDIGQLGTLFERHCKRLFDYFFRMTGSRAASEDLVQEVFVRMLKYRHTFGTDSRFTGWMFGIARNARIQYFKTKLRDPAERTQSDLDLVPSANAESERSLLLREAMLRLPEEKRELLILARYEGLTSDEIAALLGIDAGTAKVRIHRAMKQLRELVLESPEEKTKCIATKSKNILPIT